MYTQDTKIIVNKNANPLLHGKTGIIYCRSDSDDTKYVIILNDKSFPSQSLSADQFFEINPKISLGRGIMDPTSGCLITLTDNCTIRETFITSDNQTYLDFETAEEHQTLIDTQEKFLKFISEHGNNNIDLFRQLSKKPELRKELINLLQNM